MLEHGARPSTSSVRAPSLPLFLIHCRYLRTCSKPTTQEHAHAHSAQRKLLHAAHTWHSNTPNRPTRTCARAHTTIHMHTLRILVQALIQSFGSFDRNEGWSEHMDHTLVNALLPESGSTNPDDCGYEEYGKCKGAVTQGTITVQQRDDYRVVIAARVPIVNTLHRHSAPMPNTSAPTSLGCFLFFGFCLQPFLFLPCIKPRW